MHTISTEQKLHVEGHFLIEDDLGNIILDKKNAIHFQNMSLAIAQSLARKPTGPFLKFVFGNGGSTLSGVGTITYLPTNTFASNATLYNKTYEKIVNDQDTNNADPVKNKITVTHVNGNLFSDVIVSCVLENSEPSGQGAFDNTTDIEGTYVFDEMGIENYDGKLLSHVIFSPIQKSTNRIFNITYSIRFQLI